MRRFRSYIRGLITEYKEQGSIKVTDLHKVGVCTGCSGVFHVWKWVGRHREEDPLQTIAIKIQHMRNGRLITYNLDLPGVGITGSSLYCKRCRDEYHRENPPPTVETSWEGEVKVKHL